MDITERLIKRDYPELWEELYDLDEELELLKEFASHVDFIQKNVHELDEGLNQYFGRFEDDLETFKKRLDSRIEEKENGL